MDSSVLIESFAEFARQKNIDRPTMIKILNDVFRTMIRKKYDSDDNFDIIINIDKGDLEIWMFREIVDNDIVNKTVFIEDEETGEEKEVPAYDPNKMILISDAQKIEPDFEVGEEFSEEVKIEDFGRRAVMMARQTLIQKIKDLEKDNLYQKYKELVGEIITAEVYQVLGREILLIDAEGNELTLPKGEQIPKDRYRKGDNARCIVHKVEMQNGSPKIILSRVSPTFLERLFEIEIPEVYDGLIAIKKVVREPGERAKVAVESYDDRVDPVGACVGMKGSRIHSIVRELNNENIDVINFTDNIELYISRALNPAKISTISMEGDKANVYLKPDQVSLAIGKGGLNIKLASRLTEFEIDIFRELDEFEVAEEDVNLAEFTDEIDDWIIDELRRIGLDTAKSVLALTKEELVRRTDLEEEMVDDVVSILQKEFEADAQ